MKKIYTLIVFIVISIILISCDQGPKLNLYLPHEYISEDLLKEFREETGIKVVVSEFDSNEDAISSINRGTSYDLIIPSDYTIEELAARDLINEIDWDLLEVDKNNDFEQSLIDMTNKYKNSNTPFDLLKYSIPYFFGNLGLVYNKEKQGVEDLVTSKGWESLINNNDSFNRVIYRSPRDGILVALKALGLSLEDATENNINAALDWLLLTRNKQTKLLSDDILEDMIKNTPHDISIAYSGDATYLMSINENLGFFIPEEGSNIFYDGFVIPKNSKNIEAAYSFINFMLKEENAYENSLDIAYTSPLKVVYERLINGEFKDINSYFVYFRENDEIFRYNETLADLINKAWLEYEQRRTQE